MSGPKPIRILFYPHSARAFSSSLIGHLAELSQEFEVSVVTERLHPSYSLLLQNRKFFPKLQSVEEIDGLGFSLSQLRRNNRRWQKLAERLVSEKRPDVIVTENDMSSVFDMYLLRAAQRQGVRCLTIQGMLQREDTAMQKFIELLHVKGDGEGRGVKLLGRLIYFRSRKWLGHFLVHYLLPWSIGQSSLHGHSSYVLRRGASGSRDSDLNLVPSLQAFRAHTSSGVPVNKLAILPHPLRRVAHELYFAAPDSGETKRSSMKEKTILVLMTSVEVGFGSSDFRLITREHRRETRLKILRLVHATLPGWSILLKPHPLCGSVADVQEYFAPIRQWLTILPPSVPVEPHLQTCDAILDLPLSLTTTLFTAVCATPEKPAISANVDNEFYGDYYMDYPEIDYVENFSDLERVLQQIADGTYRKNREIPIIPRLSLEFATTNEAVHYLLNLPARARS